MSYPEKEMAESRETPFSPEDRIRQLKQEVDTLRQENQTLSRLAQKDPLTGLDNRRRLEEEMPRQLMGAIRRGEELSAIFVDLDDFKSINDTYGHPVGDRVLQSVSTTILGGVRLTDLVFRYGGEEIVVLLPDTVKVRAVEVAERLRQSVSDLTVISGDQTLGVTISLGVDSLNPKSMNLPRRITQDLLFSLMGNLISGTDRAMYEAKQGGKNSIRVIISNPEEEQAMKQVNEQTQRNIILKHK